MERQLIEEYTGTNFNIWDEKWELGYINNSTGQNTTATNQIRSTNYIPVTPNTVYYWKAPNVNGRLFMYGSGKNFITQSTSTINNKFTTGPSVYYLRFTCGTGYGTTYKNDICLNLSQTNPSISPRNGDYVPHQKSKNYVVLETCGQVDLGRLYWFYENGIRWVSEGLIPLLPTLSVSEKPPFECTTYPVLAYNDRTGICLTAGQSKRIYVFGLDSSTRPSGILTYELSAPKPFAIKNVITI